MKTKAFGVFCGVPARIRTGGVPLRRRTLYPAEVQRPICCFIYIIACLFRKGKRLNATLGGGRSIRLSYGNVWHYYTFFAARKSNPVLLFYHNIQRCARDEFFNGASKFKKQILPKCKRSVSAILLNAEQISWKKPSRKTWLFGGGKEIRTLDLSHVKRTL